MTLLLLLALLLKLVGADQPTIPSFNATDAPTNAPSALSCVEETAALRACQASNFQPGDREACQECVIGTIPDTFSCIDAQNAVCPSFAPCCGDCAVESQAFFVCGARVSPEVPCPNFSCPEIVIAPTTAPSTVPPTFAPTLVCPNQARVASSCLRMLSPDEATACTSCLDTARPDGSDCPTLQANLCPALQNCMDCVPCEAEIRQLVDCEYVETGLCPMFDCTETIAEEPTPLLCENEGEIWRRCMFNEISAADSRACASCVESIVPDRPTGCSSFNSTCDGFTACSLPCQTCFDEANRWLSCQADARSGSRCDLSCLAESSEPPPDPGLDIEMIAIISGAVGGALLLVAMVWLLRCLRRRKRLNQTESFKRSSSAPSSAPRFSEFLVSTPAPQRRSGNQRLSDRLNGGEDKPLAVKSAPYQVVPKSNHHFEETKSSKRVDDDPKVLGVLPSTKPKDSDFEERIGISPASELENSRVRGDSYRLPDHASTSFNTWASPKEESPSEILSTSITSVSTDLGQDPSGIRGSLIDPDDPSEIGPNDPSGIRGSQLDESKDTGRHGRFVHDDDSIDV